MGGIGLGVSVVVNMVVIMNGGVYVEIGLSENFLIVVEM